MKKIISIVSLFMFPIVAFGDVTDANTLFALIETILGYILPILISIAVIWFIYNVFAYVIAGDEEKKKEAKNNMIWGIVALFVMTSVWGFVNILGGTLGLKTTPPSLPGLPGISSYSR